MGDTIEISSDDSNPGDLAFSSVPIKQQNYHDLSASDDDAATLPASPSSSPLISFGLLSSQSGESLKSCLSDPLLFEPLSSQAYGSQSEKDDGVPNKRRKRTKEELEKAKEEKEEAKARRAAEKALKLKEKQRKAEEKAQRGALAEKYRQMKPGECMKFITVHMDSSLREILGKTLTLLNENEIKHQVEVQREPATITWTRNQSQTDDDKADHVLFVWMTENLVTSAKYCTLRDTFQTYSERNPGINVSLAVLGLNDYYRKSKAPKPANNEGGTRRRKSDGKPTRRDIETALTELELFCGVSSRIIANEEELATLIYQFTKAVAETPYKRQRQEKDLEKNWYARGDSRDCVRVDKNMNGLHELWIQQLAQYTMSSLDTAKTIASVYPTPLKLYEAYQSCQTQTEKDLLLQDLQIRRGADNLGRRIGPRLSKKICLMFTQSDGDVMLD